MNEISQISSDGRHFDFHLEEFKLLKEEILQQQRIRLQLELFTISAAGLIASFLVANKPVIDAAQAEITWFAPLLVLYFGLIWSRSHVHRSSEIGAYLAKVEACLGSPELGWERTVAPLKIERGGAMSRAKRNVWIGIFVFFGLLAARFGLAPLWHIIGLV